MKLNISDIQHFSLGDGDGIRSTVFFKGCNLRCPWCHNPETISQEPQILRYENLQEEKAVGRMMTVAEIMDDVMTDIDFYTESGGGVTLSGGEAMLQADGARDLAAALRAQGIHVIMDTAGNVPYSEFEKVNPYISQYYYDWKACSERDYLRVTGGDYRLILENMKRLIAEGHNVRARVPLIPGFNTGSSYSERMCECLRYAAVKEVDLLPFHRLGAGKYRALGKQYAYRAKPPLSAGEAEEAAAVYRKYFQVKIEK